MPSEGLAFGKDIRQADDPLIQQIKQAKFVTLMNNPKIKGWSFMWEPHTATLVVGGEAYDCITEWCNRVASLN